MKDTEFYQGHLNGVSRSFAFCIEKLADPLRRWVSLSYLLCRVLDTVEDSAWDSAEIQQGQYDRFEKFMLTPPSSTELSAWAARFPSSIPESEKTLLSDAFALFVDFHALEPRARNAIQPAVLQMCRGMKHYSGHSPDGRLRLRDLADANRYCYFVAGVVGELLSRVFVVYRPAFNPPPEFHINALHFGLFLQKINLLKDQRSDERLGRFLVPDRARLTASLRPNARGAMDYLLSLPLDEKGYRVFCAWSLFLGVASMPWMRQAYDLGDGSKIPRSVTQELLAAIEAMVLDNAALESAFQENISLLPSAEPEIREAQDDDGSWFRDLAGASLLPSDMAALGMI